MTTLSEHPRPHPEPAEENDLIDYALLRELAGFVLLRAPRRHLALAVSCFVSVVLLAVVALAFLPKRWEVQGSILAQSNPLILGARGDSDRLRANRDFVLRRDNLISIVNQTNFLDRHLASRSLASRSRDYIFRVLRGREPTTEERLEDILDGMESRLWVLSAAEGTITIGFEWSNRELTYDVVKVALQNFIEARRATEVSSIAETLSILGVHAAAAQKEIAAASQRLADRERQVRGARAASQRPTRVRVAPDAEVTKLDAVLEGKKRAYRTLEDFRERRRTELQAELAQQQQIYAPAHPALMATKNNLEAVNRPSPELESLRADVTELEREIKSRGGRPGESSRLFQEDIADARMRLDDEDPRLEQERHELRLAFRNYSNLLSDMATARVAQDTASAGFKYRFSMVTPAQLPKAPSKPKPLRIMAMAVLGGLLFALFAAAATDLRTGVVIEPWQVRGLVKAPILAELRQPAPPA